MRRRRSLRVGGLLLAAAFLFPHLSVAQGAYAGAALMGDFVRLDRVDLGGSSGTAGGEALGFALRLGTPLGRNWGVELEWARPALIESDETPDFIPLAAGTVTSPLPAGINVPPGVDALSIARFPQAFPYRIHTTRRSTTLSTSVWASQEVSRRVSLVYLGGVAFHRSTFTSDVSYERFSAFASVIFPPSYSLETLAHSVRPLAGFEARIDLTEHVQLVPGIRLHGIADGWLIRPAAALAWKF